MKLPEIVIRTGSSFGLAFYVLPSLTIEKIVTGFTINLAWLFWDLNIDIFLKEMKS